MDTRKIWASAARAAVVRTRLSEADTALGAAQIIDKPSAIFCASPNLPKRPDPRKPAGRRLTKRVNDTGQRYQVTLVNVRFSTLLPAMSLIANSKRNRINDKCNSFSNGRS